MHWTESLIQEVQDKCAEQLGRRQRRQIGSEAQHEELAIRTKGIRRRSIFQRTLLASSSVNSKASSPVERRKSRASSCFAWNLLGEQSSTNVVDSQVRLGLVGGAAGATLLGAILSSAMLAIVSVASNAAGRNKR